MRRIGDTGRFCARSGRETGAAPDAGRRPALLYTGAGKEEGNRMERIKERLRRLRERMREYQVTVYVIPSSDCHESEYVCAHYRAREYMSGFTGSAGTLVVTMEEAGLWTDGRYFLQAEQQLRGTGIHLFRSGEPGVPKIVEYVDQKLSEGGILGFDGRTMGAHRAEELILAAEKKGAGALVTEDLAGQVWEDRPKIPDTELYVLDLCYAGEDTKDRLARVRAEMERTKADIHVLGDLCDIAWLLNIRGGDIPCVPVALSFLCITKEDCIWYVREQIVTEEIRRYLKERGVRIRDYEAVYEDLSGLAAGQKVLLDKKNVNYRLLTAVSSQSIVIDQRNLTELMKAVKNETEIRNLRTAHLKEGIAFTRLMYWLKTSAGKEEMTERSVADYLDARRREQEHYLGQSFAPISAYGANGAIVHYSPTEESDAKIRPEGFLLVDAGGHYLEGTTDTTRTFAMGELTPEQKKMFTAVCRGNLNLAYARFLHGCTGYSLDILCREPLWQAGVDYKHGTGHGVGYLLNVHEGPNAFRFKLPEQEQPAILEAGMVTTDEPGIYIEGKYGIRTENELLCVKRENNPYGQFMEFEILTLTPIDLDAVLPQEMTKTERERLNDYHEKVYRTLSPHLTEEERDWLRIATRRI